MKTLFKILFWFLSLTWGFLMSFIGVIVFLVTIIFVKHKVHSNGCSVIVEFGGNWGGLSLGCFAFCGRYSESNNYWFQHTRKHEFGHSIQNAILGPLFPFIIAIPSSIRYHYKRIAVKKGKTFSTGWYDSIWFERTATKYGTKAVNWLEN